MSMSRRLILSFLAIGAGISLLGFAAVTWLSWNVTLRDGFHTAAVIHVHAVEAHLNTAVEDVLFTLAGNGGERGDFQAALAAADAEIDAFAAIAHLDDPAEAEERRLFERIVDARDALESQATLLLDEHAAAAAPDPGRLAAYESLVEGMNTDLEQLLEIERLEVTAAQASAIGAIRTAKGMLAGIACVSVLGAFLVGHVAARRLVRPLRELEAAARDASEGRLEPVVVSGPGEITVLADAFNSMVADVAAARSSLEAEVATRTAELEVAIAALRRSEQRYHDLYEHAPDMYLSVDATTGRIVEFNQRCCDVLGYARHELDGMFVRGIWDESNRAQVTAAFGAFQTTGRAQAPDLLLRRRNGTTLRVSLNATAVRDASGAVVRSRSILRDVTAEYQAQQKLAREEERSRTLIEHAPICIHEVDRNGRILSMNKTGLEMLGREACAVVGTAYLDNVALSDRERVRRLLNLALTGRAAEFEFVSDSAGAPRIYRSSFIPIRDPGGVVDKLMGLTEDVTERRSAERQTQIMVDELDHRVKNNLAAVLSLAQQSLATSGSLAEFEASFVGRVAAMARTHEALARAKWGEVGLAAVIRVAIGAYGDHFDGRVQSNGPPVEVPPEMTAPLGLALHELATNAAKYGALGSADGFVEIKWRACNGHLTDLEWIESNGPAPSGEEQAGFGLQLVRGLVEHQIGGRVDIEFAGTGAHHRISFPGPDRETPAPGQPHRHELEAELT